MAVHRKTATLTVGASGVVEEDVRVYPVSSTGRLTKLLFVETETSGADGVTLDIREVDVDDDGEETPGRILLHIDEVDDRRYEPLVTSETVSPEGDAIASQYGHQAINTDEVQVEVTGPVGAEVTVDIFYETAGDQRF